MTHLTDYYRNSEEYRAVLSAQDAGVFNPYVALFERFVSRDGPVLDVGCGTGTSTFLLRRAGFDALGVDVSDRFLPTNADGFFALDFERADELESDAYAAAGAMNVIEHVGQPQKFLSTLVRIVRPGGHVILLSPNLTSPAVAVRALLDMAQRRTPYLGLSGPLEAIVLLFRNVERSSRAALGADRFSVRSPRMEQGIVGFDTDAVYWSNAPEVRRFLERAGCQVCQYQRAGRSGAARMVARALPSFAGQLCIVARKQTASRLGGRTGRKPAGARPGE